MAITHQQRADDAEHSLLAIGFDLTLTAESKLRVANLGLRAATLPIAMRLSLS